jgi:cell volume regulation protein A
MTDGEMILAAGLLLALGILAALLAGRLSVPGLVLFLALGMLLGDEGLGVLPFDDYELAKTIGVIALVFIIYEGGLAAGWPEIRPVLRPALSLALIGTTTTAVVTGLAAAALLGLSVTEGLLLGAILSSTDGAAIFALLRHSTLRRPLARALEGEAGMNDPIAILLVLGFIETVLHPDYGVDSFILLFVVQIGIGTAVGLGLGWLAVEAFQRTQLATVGLFPVASLAIAGIAFGGADVLGGSGFLAVYLVGLALGGAQIPAKRTITAFHEGMAWVAQLTAFFTLGLLVFPSALVEVWVEGTAIAIVLAVVARPVAAFLATMFLGYTVRERTVLGWAGLRGAVPIVLATFPIIEGVPNSEEFFSIVFFAVLFSTLLQGSTFETLAARLGATTTEPALPRVVQETGTIRRLGAEVVEFPVGPRDAIVGLKIRDLGLPREALVNVIVRGDEAIPPRGANTIEAGDSLHVLIRSSVAREVGGLLERWRTGPIGPPERVPRAPRAHATPFTVRPWDAVDGDPAEPATVAGRVVVDRLRLRRDRPGSLVLLDDGVLAVCGETVALGRRDLLGAYARRRLARATADSDRAWWSEVIGAVAR